MNKRDRKHWKTKKEEFNEFVDFLRHKDWKKSGIVGYFVHSDYNQPGNEEACCLVSVIIFLISFCFFHGLNYCFRLIGIYWVIRNLVETVIGIVFCCLGFYIAFGKKTDRRHNELNRSTRIDWFVLTVFGILLVVWKVL